MIEYPEGLLAIFLGVFIFIGSVYVLVALNTGWRFGYWITGASLGGLMLFLSLFWVASALGPRGAEPRWIPAGVSPTQIDQVVTEDETYTSPRQYPSGPWEEPEEEGFLAEQVDALGSAISNCLAADRLPTDLEQEVCDAAQELLPTEDQIPVVEGMRAIVVEDMQNVRFAEEAGVLLGKVQIVPLTRDPRLAEDPDVGLPVGDPFFIVAVRDPGALRLPAFQYLIASTIWFAFHMWGLSRAERRRLSPVAV